MISGDTQPTDTGTGGGGDTTGQNGGSSSDSSTWISVINAIASVGKAILGAFGARPSTTHMDWDSANVQALAFSKAVEDNTLKQVGSSKLDSVGDRYRLNMISFIQGVRGTRWGEGYPENTDNIVHGLQTFPSSADRRSKVFVTTWLWMMWILRNSDLNNPDERQAMMSNDLNRTLVPAIQNTGGVKTPTIPVVTVNPTTGAITVAPTSSGVLAGFTSTDVVVTLGAVAGLLYFGKMR